MYRFARFSAGMALKGNGDVEGAIDAFYSAIPLTVPSPPDFDDADDYRVASIPHMAALAIADCLEEAGDRVGCLRFLLLSLEKYPYYNYCGNCFMAHMQVLERRIADLEKAIRS